MQKHQTTSTENPQEEDVTVRITFEWWYENGAKVNPAAVIWTLRSSPCCWRLPVLAVAIYSHMLTSSTYSWPLSTHAPVVSLPLSCANVHIIMRLCDRPGLQSTVYLPSVCVIPGEMSGLTFTAQLQRSAPNTGRIVTAPGTQMSNLAFTPYCC